MQLMYYRFSPLFFLQGLKLNSLSGALASSVAAAHFTSKTICNFS